MIYSLPFIIPGIILTLAGGLIFIFSAGQFRSALGFRTELSFKNMDVWRASNRVFGAAIAVSGFISLTLGFLFFYIFNDIPGIIVILILSFISVFISFYYTDNFTKTFYDDSGYRIK